MKIKRQDTSIPVFSYVMDIFLFSHPIVMGASGYIYHDNPSTGVNYWALNTDGSATFGCGAKEAAFFNPIFIS